MKDDGASGRSGIANGLPVLWHLMNRVIIQLFQVCRSSFLFARNCTNYFTQPPPFSWEIIQLEDSTVHVLLSTWYWEQRLNEILTPPTALLGSVGLREKDTARAKKLVPLSTPAVCSSNGSLVFCGVQCQRQWTAWDSCPMGWFLATLKQAVNWFFCQTFTVNEV